LKRGTQALPEGQMILGSTQRDAGLQFSDFVRPYVVPNKGLVRGTVALPEGPMDIQGTTMRDLGSMYTYIGPRE